MSYDNIASKNEIHFFNPSNFDLQSRLPDNLKKFLPHIQYFIYQVWQAHNRRRRANHDYVPLMAAHIRKLLPHHSYSKIINVLLSLEIIERDEFYIKNEKSYGYRLGSAIRELPFSKYSIESKQLMRKLTNIERRKPDLLDKTVKALHVHFMRARIDGHNARKWLQSHVRKQSKFGVLSDSIDCFEQVDRRHFKKCDDTRVHSSITNMKRQLRNFLYFENLNESLTEIDLSNSQPYFLNCLMCVFNGKYFIDNNNKTSIKHNTNTPSPSPFPLPDMMLLSRKTLFGELVSNGTLYDYLSLVAKRTRRQVKRGMMPLMFSPVDERPVLTPFFEEHFPDVLKFIHQINKNNHKELSRLLQQEESSFIIDDVSRTLIETTPDMPFLTVHDSLIVPRSQVEYVSETIKRLAIKRYGIAPHLKTKDLGSAI